MVDAPDFLTVGNVALNSHGKVGVITGRIDLCRKRTCGYLYHGHEIGNPQAYWEGVEVVLIAYSSKEYRENGGEARAREAMRNRHWLDE